jgi:hypothetical protein
MYFHRCFRGTYLICQHVRLPWWWRQYVTRNVVKHVQDSTYYSEAHPRRYKSSRSSPWEPKIASSYSSVCKCSHNRNATVLFFLPSVLRTLLYMFRRHMAIFNVVIKLNYTPWPESTSELYQPSDRRLSVKLVPTFADGRVSRSQRGWSPTAVVSIF